MSKEIKKIIKRSSIIRGLFDYVKYNYWIRRNRKIFANILKPVTPKYSGRIIFLTVRTLVASPITYLDAFIAHGFKKLGFEVDMLVCDNVLSSCDADTYFDVKHRAELCSRCRKFRSKLIDSLNLNYRSFKEYISCEKIVKIKEDIYSKSPNDLVNTTLYGVKVAEHARSSTVRYFLIDHVDLNKEDHKKVFLQKLLDAIIVVEVANAVFEKYGKEIKHAITVHGVYSTWGPFYDYFKMKGIDTLIYSKGTIRYQSVSFLRYGREWETFYPETWKSLQKRPLAEEEEKKLETYIDGRFKKKMGADLQLYEDFSKGSHSDELRKINAYNYKYRYIIFTHLVWDSCLENQSPAFSDSVEMLDMTIEYFLKHKDKQLIIKIHPAEIVWEEGSSSMIQHISQKYPNFTENIVVLPPNTKVSPYEVVNDKTVGITYIGTVGYELSALGVPVIIGGHIHYNAEGGLGCLVKSKQEYIGYLEDPSSLFPIAKSKIEQAKKWCYYFAYLVNFDFPIYSKTVWAAIDWSSLKNINAWLDDDGSSIMRVCNKIAKHEDVVDQ